MTQKWLPASLTDVHDAVFLWVEEQPVVEQGQFGIRCSNIRLQRVTELKFSIDMQSKMTQVKGF